MQVWLEFSHVFSQQTLESLEGCSIIFPVSHYMRQLLPIYTCKAQKFMYPMQTLSILHNPSTIIDILNHNCLSLSNEPLVND